MQIHDHNQDVRTKCHTADQRVRFQSADDAGAQEHDAGEHQAELVDRGDVSAEAMHDDRDRERHRDQETTEQERKADEIVLAFGFAIPADEAGDEQYGADDQAEDLELLPRIEQAQLVNAGEDEQRISNHHDDVKAPPAGMSHQDRNSVRKRKSM